MAVPAGSRAQSCTLDSHVISQRAGEDLDVLTGVAAVRLASTLALAHRSHECLAIDVTRLPNADRRSSMPVTWFDSQTPAPPNKAL